MEKVKQQSPSKLLIEKIAIDKALLLLNEIEIPTTEVCKFVYGSKTKKSTLNQKKTGVSPLFFEESCKIIDFYGDVAKKINKLIHD